MTRGGLLWGVWRDGRHVYRVGCLLHGGQQVGFIATWECGAVLLAELRK